MFIERLPPDQTFSLLLQNANYQLAGRYLVYDLLLVMLALLWGSGLIAGLQRRESLSSAPSIGRGPLAAVAVGGGFSLLIAGIFLLALFQVYTPSAMVLLTVTMSVLSLFALWTGRQQLHASCTGLSWRRVLSGAFVLLLCVAYQFSAVCSWMLGDGTSYHVPYADYILQHHGLLVPEYLIYPFHTLNINLFYSLGLMIEHELSYVQTLHALFVMLSVFTMYQFGIATGQRSFVVGAMMLVFVSLYEIYYSRFMANVDNGSMYFVLVSVFSLYLWQEHRRQWLLVISASTFGMAIGSKYFMCVLALPFAICIMLTAGWRQCWRPALVFAGWAAVFGLWWYVRNWILTGNPVHPFATGIFGFYQWDASDIESQMVALQEERIPRSVKGFLLMPLFAFNNEILYSHGAFLVIALLYGATLLSVFVGRRLWLLPVFCWCYLLPWMAGYQETRYLQPIFPLVFVYAGYVANALLCKLLGVERRGVGARIWSGVSWLAAIAVFAALAFAVQQQVIRVFFYKLLPGDAREQEARQNPEYELVSEANRFFLPNETAYEFFLRNGRWFFRGNMVGTQFGPHGYERMMRNVAKADGYMSPQKLEAILRERYNAVGFLIPELPYVYYDHAEFDRYFDLKYRNANGAIYRLRAQH